MRRVFRSLRSFNYRVWAAGALVSNVGTWMQRAAQDWLVLTQLTHHSASAVGIVMALQFGPQLLLMPWSGFAADHFDQRKLLMATQATMGALALILGILTVTGLVQLWHVYTFAFLSGCAQRSMPRCARHSWPNWLMMRTFERDRVELDLVQRRAHDRTGRRRSCHRLGRNRLGVPVQRALVHGRPDSMSLLRTWSFARMRGPSHQGKCPQGFHYAWSRPDLRATLVMLFLIGTFGLNFPIFISTMAVSVFHPDARAMACCPH